MPFLCDGRCDGRQKRVTGPIRDVEGARDFQVANGMTEERRHDFVDDHFRFRHPRSRNRDIPHPAHCSEGKANI